MALLKIQTEQGVKRIFIAAEGISDLATVELSPGGARYVAMGSTTNQHLVAGVARGLAASGQLIWVVTEGFVSGVKTNQTVNAGDRLAIATSGRVTPFNTITPTGYPLISGSLLMSGYFASGFLSGVLSGYGYPTSGFVQANISGAFVGTAFNTGRVLGKALTSGLSGLGIQMIVSVE